MMNQNLMSREAELLKRKLSEARIVRGEYRVERGKASAALGEAVEQVRRVVRELASAGHLAFGLQVYVSDEAPDLVLSGNAVHVVASCDHGEVGHSPVTLFMLWRGAHGAWHYASVGGPPGRDVFATARCATEAALLDEAVVEQMATALAELM